MINEQRNKYHLESRQLLVDMQLRIHKNYEEKKYSTWRKKYSTDRPVLNKQKKDSTGRSV
jgi:hypothetical protein